MTGLTAMIIAGNPDEISTQVFEDKENGKFGGAIWFNDKTPSGCSRPRPLVSFKGYFETEPEAQAHLDELIELAKKHAPGIADGALDALSGKTPEKKSSTGSAGKEGRTE